MGPLVRKNRERERRPRKRVEVLGFSNWRKVTVAGVLRLEEGDGCRGPQIGGGFGVRTGGGLGSELEGA
uniref:Uncharacterized protein n=1 Tax=Cannabis sativa TaxID=3483 RepID=A0A803PZ40_CANSA